MIRPATPADIPAIVDLAVESVSINPLPVTISRPAMAAAAASIIGKASQFCWVAEEGGKVVATVGALVQPGFWFERQQASVLMFYTRAPGACIPLLREFARWIKARPVIKLAIFELEPDADPRLERLLVRLGFGRKSTNLVYVRSRS